MRKPFIVLVLFFAVLGTGCHGDEKVSLGLLEIFNKFIDVTDLVGQVPPILQNIAGDIVDDIRHLIPEIEKLLADNNITEVVLTELGKGLNVTRVTHELIPQLDEALKNDNVTEKIEDIVSYLKFSNINDKLLPELDNFVKSNNISQIFVEIRKLINVTVICNLLLPEIERFLEGENITAIVGEVRKFLDMADISGKLVPTIARIFDSNNVSQIVAQIDYLLNLTHLAEQILPGLGKLFEEIKINETIAEIRKFLNITHVGGQLLDEVEKMLDESNITYHVPELKPFLNISIIREKLAEVERILDYLNISEILDEIEKHLDVDYLISKVPDLDEFLESVGLTKLLTDIKELLEMSSIKNNVDEIKKFMLSANITDKIDDLEKLLNVTYLERVICAELKRMVRENNLTDLVGEVEKFLNTTYLSENIVPEIRKIWDDLDGDAKLEMFIKLTNTSYWIELLTAADRQYNITLKGQQIAEGDLPGVVNEILDNIFVKADTDDPIVVHPTTLPPGPTKLPPGATTLTPGPTEKTTLPPVCITDCHGVPCGSAIINSCKKCVKGTTGRPLNDGMDCNNVCNGAARNDTCGACSNPPENDQTGRDSPYADCHHTCFGSAAIDNCSDCTGGKTGKQTNYRKDKCGVCGGDNSTCAGCDGVPNSGLVNDSCNVCGGDGSTCTSISKVVPSMLPTTSSSSRTVVVHGAGLDGQSVKCIFNGVASAGTLVDRTHCKCTIPSDQTAGSKSFTVKVVKGGGDVPTADLTITLYDAVNTKITSLAPAEIFTSETTVITFGGTGLPDSPDAVCMVNGTKIPAVFSSGSYNCTLPSYATSKQITVALSLNGVHELASDVALTRTVYARPPTLNSAQFSDTGALINVEFSKDCATSSLTSCSVIFDSASLPRLGTSPGCSWSDARHLIISPAADASISPNDALTLKANAVKSGGEQYAKYATASINVQAPANPAKPVPVIVGPTQISSCGNLSLNGGQSSGGGGRDLKYTWSLVSTSNAAITAVLDAAQDNPKVLIIGSLMTAGSSYTFRLAVKNFLSSSSEHNDIAVTKATTPLPEVTINGPLEGKALAANTFHIAATAKAATCSSDKALAYTWTVTCTNDDASNAAKIRAEASAGFKETSSKSALKVDGGSLIGGKIYVFKVVVALKATPSTATTMETTVTAEWSALQAAISGGDRTVGRDSGSLVLDGESSTVDPDNAGGDLVCSWICEDMSNNQPCYSAVNKQNKIPFPNQCRITIASTEFEAERSYKIKSQVSKGSRAASASITLTVIAGKPPVVSVVTSHLKISSGEKVGLRGTYTSSIKPTEVKWSCAQENGYRYVDLADASLISSTFETYKADGESFFVKIIKANILTPGASYKFILNVNDGSKVGSSNMIVEVRSGPTSGSFEASPTTLAQLETVTLTAPRWVTDSDANPLEYEFGFVDDKGIFQPWATQTNNEYSIAVPPGYGSSNQLTLKLKVSDAFDSVKWAEKKITVTPLTSINEQKLETMIDASLQEAKDTGDFSKAVPNMRNILQTVLNNSGVSADFAKKVTSSTVDTLLLAVDATSLDRKTAEPILKTFLQVNPKYIEKGDDVLSGVKDVVKASGENLGKATIDETLTFVAELSSKVNLSDAKVLEDLTSLDDSLASSLASGVDLGEPAVETSADNPRAVIKVAHSVLEGSIQAKTGSDATGVEFGSELSKQYGNWKCGTSQRCLGVKVKMISYKKDYYSDISSSKPDIIPDKIISLSLQNPETGDDLSVSGLSKPVKLTFQVGTPSDGKKFVSYYFDEIKKVWSSEGMTWVLESDKLVVSVIHLTSFSPAEEPTKLDSDDDNTGLIIGLVVGLTFGVLFVVLLVAWCVYRSKKNAKVRSSRFPVKEYDNDGMEQEMAPV